MCNRMMIPGLRNLRLFLQDFLEPETDSDYIAEHRGRSPGGFRCIKTIPTDHEIGSGKFLLKHFIYFFEQHLFILSSQ